MANEQVQNNANIILNVVKRRDQFRIVAASSASNVNIAYLAGESISSDRVIHNTDRSGELSANWGIEDSDYEVFVGQSKILRYYQFLVTDVFVGGDSSGSVKLAPLFWKHSVQKRIKTLLSSLGESDINPSGAITIVAMQVLDRNMKEYKHPQIQYDLTNGVVYSNLQNEFDFHSGRWNLYYVRYALRYTRGDSSVAHHVYTDLLSQEPIFILADTDDLNPDLSLKITADAYLITENYGYIEITLPLNTTYAVRPRTDNKIQLVMPEGLSVEVPWFARVSNGRVLSLSGGVPYIYDVPEYLTKQSFFPFPPFKYVQEELMTRVTKSVYKANRERIVMPGVTSGVGEDATTMHPVVYAYNEADTLTAIFTSQGALLGKRDDTLGGLRWKAILGVDVPSGLVYLDYEIPANWKLYVTYYYEEMNYEITDIDFNPTMNNDIVGTMVVIYLVPESIGYGLAGREASIHFLYVDRRGRITYCSQDGSDGNPDWSAVVGSTYSSFRATKCFPDYKTLILGEISISPNQQPADLDKVDVRREGGGLSESIIESVLETT